MPIRVMEPDDIPVAMSVINQEGWGYTLPEIERMLRLEPGGSFLYGPKEPLGAITTVVHGSIGVIGHLVVSRKARGRGIGGALLSHAIDHLHSRGSDSIIVIATDEGCPLYSKHGFVVEREILCKHLMLGPGKMPLRPGRPELMVKTDLREVSDIDRELFGDDRSKLISLLYEESPGSCFKLVGAEGIEGFSMGRNTANGFDFGPWVCRTGSPKDAEELLDAALSTARQAKIYSGMFADNRAAVTITEKLPLFKMWSTKLMVLGKSRCYPHTDQLYGIAAFELG